MSAGFPYFFIPKKIARKNIIVDGGLLSNFPLWVFESKSSMKNQRPVLGIKLTGTDVAYPHRKINNALDMFPALFTTMMEAHDSRYISKTSSKNIIFIPVDSMVAVDFSIDEETRFELMN